MDIGIMQKTISIQLKTWQKLTKKKADMNADSLDTVINDLFDNQSADSSPT